MSYPPDDPQGGQYPPPPGYGPPPGYAQGGFGPPPPGYGPGGPGGPGQPPYQEPIPNYMWQAIVITVLGVLCCCIGLVSSGFGVAALVTASKVGERQRIGDIQGALEASKRIKTFLVIGAAVLAFGLVSWAILLSTADWDFYADTT